MNDISLLHIALIYLAVIRSSFARLLPKGRKNVFPIDGRIGNGYTLGGRQFIERFKVGLFVPMHFTTGFESAWRFKEFTEEKKIPFWAALSPGECATLCRTFPAY